MKILELLKKYRSVIIIGLLYILAYVVFAVVFAYVAAVVVGI